MIRLILADHGEAILTCIEHDGIFVLGVTLGIDAETIVQMDAAFGTTADKLLLAVIIF